MRKIIFILLPLGLTTGMAAANAQAADRISVPVSGLRNDTGIGAVWSNDRFPQI